MHRLAISALTLRSFQHQHEVGRTEKAPLVALLRGEVAERDRQVGLWVLPTPEGPSNKMFSARSTNARLASSMICGRGAPVAKGEVVLIERAS